jgi:hypothetical protein
MEREESVQSDRPLIGISLGDPEQRWLEKVCGASTLKKKELAKKLGSAGRPCGREPAKDDSNHRCLPPGSGELPRRRNNWVREIS